MSGAICFSVLDTVPECYASGFQYTLSGNGGMAATPCGLGLGSWGPVSAHVSSWQPHDSILAAMAAVHVHDEAAALGRPRPPSL